MRAMDSYHSDCAKDRDAAQQKAINESPLSGKINAYLAAEESYNEGPGYDGMYDSTTLNTLSRGADNYALQNPNTDFIMFI